MIREYSISDIKNNKSSAISIMIIVAISTMFLTLVIGIFYNMWSDNISRIIAKEGDWHGQIIGKLNSDEVEKIRNNVKIEEIRIEKETSNQGEIIYIRLKKTKGIYNELPKIVEDLKTTDSQAVKIIYHDTLLSEHFIFSQEEKNNPPLLLAFYLFIVVLIAIVLIFIMYNAFGIALNTKVRQLGTLMSIGATPNQIKQIITLEGAFLSIIPIIIGIIGGIVSSYGFISIVNFISSDFQKQKVNFTYSIPILIGTIIACGVSVFLANWSIAKKLSKISILEAVKEGHTYRIKKMKKFRFISKIAGIKGELARKSLYIRRKSFRVSSISLIISFLVFSIFLNFMSLSDISTKYSYFERYKDRWDFLIKIDDMNLQENILSDLRVDNKIKNCTGYQKISSKVKINKNQLSKELQQVGGLDKLSDSPYKPTEQNYTVDMPIIVLDDISYKEYCKNIGYTEGENNSKSILINTIWDSKNSHFREKKNIPFVKDSISSMNIDIDDKKHNRWKCQIGYYTDKMPKLREEFKVYSLTQVMSESNYKSIFKSNIGSEYYINILTISHNNTDGIQESLEEHIPMKYKYSIENRVVKEENDVTMRKGMKLIIGGICLVIGCIGIISVYSAVLGHMGQRKKEFAQYISMGFTPEEMKNIIITEGILFAIKPILISLPFNLIFVVFATTASKIKLGDFFSQAPIFPITIYCFIIIFSVSILYMILLKKLYKENIVEILRNNSL